MAIIYYPKSSVLYKTDTDVTYEQVAIATSPTSIFYFDESGNLQSFSASTLYFTASNSIICDTASFLLGSIESASFSSYAISASWAPPVPSDSASYSAYAVSASNAVTASYALSGVGGSGTTLSTGSSYPITASWAVNWNSSSVLTLIGNKQNSVATGSSVPWTASWASQASSASFWDSSSVVSLINTKQNTIPTGSLIPVTSSWANNSITSSYTPKTFSRGGSLVNMSTITTSGSIVVWYAPYSATVTNVRGYRVGGTTAVINARKNGTDNHLASDLTISSADTWTDGGAVQNTAYVVGDKLEITFVTGSAGTTQLAIQVDLTR